MSFVLAIDAGTTGVRAILFDARGEAVSAAYRELPVSFPRPGWAEQDARRLWQATVEVIAGAVERARIDSQAVVAVGIANQRASVVAWDAGSLDPLSPLITWQDGRTADRCVQLQEQGIFVHAKLSLTKAEWIVRHIEEAATAAAGGRLRLGTPDSWLDAKLTGGAHVTDHSNASATGMYAHLTKGWDEQLLDAVALPVAALPRIVDSAGVIGRVEAEVAVAGAEVAAVCGDQQASLYGLGCTRPGQTKCSYGTAAMVDANSGGEIQMGGPGTYPLVAWARGDEAAYCVEGSVITAGAAVQWLRDGLGIVNDAADTDSLARSVPDSGGVWAVPALQGLGTPWLADGARALIGGLSRGSSSGQVVRAVLESIAHRVTDVAEAVWLGCRERPATLRADGGASRNDFLMQRQADYLGIPVERSAESDGAALGVAALAAAAYHGEDSPEAPSWHAEHVFEPRLSDDERQREREQWCARIEGLKRGGLLD